MNSQAPEWVLQLDMEHRGLMALELLWVLLVKTEEKLNEQNNLLPPPLLLMQSLPNLLPIPLLHLICCGFTFIATARVLYAANATGCNGERGNDYQIGGDAARRHSN